MLEDLSCNLQYYSGSKILAGVLSVNRSWPRFLRSRWSHWQYHYLYCLRFLLHSLDLFPWRLPIPLHPLRHWNLCPHIPEESRHCSLLLLRRQPNKKEEMKNCVFGLIPCKSHFINDSWHKEEQHVPLKNGSLSNLIFEQPTGKLRL